MRAAASLSEHPIPAHAVGEIAGDLLERLGGPVDLLCVFIGPGLSGAVDDIVASLNALLSPAVMVGTTACGVIGQDVEVEDRPAISVWAATGVDVAPFRLAPGEIAPRDGWQSLVSGCRDATAILLADPFSCPVGDALAAAAVEEPDLVLVGGLASAAAAPGGNRLVLDGEVYIDGAVGVRLTDASLTTVVAQGCQPIGDAFTVTGVEGNVLTGLGLRSPMERLDEIVAAAGERERSLLAAGVHIGVVIDERQDSFRRGDFLIRGVLGADRQTGAVAIGANVEVGATVQFQVRDAVTASDDLHAMLAEKDAIGALTFTCNGRGERLFGRPGHDAEAVHLSTGSLATAGMFCAGEIGPVGGANHMHGFTASTVLFGR